MCLAIPGKVLSKFEAGGLTMARVQFGTLTREACLSYVPQAEVGDYVLVHVGFAISRVDENEAEQTYRALAELNQLSELDAPEVHESHPPPPARSASASRPPLAATDEVQA